MRLDYPFSRSEPTRRHPYARPRRGPQTLYLWAAGIAFLAIAAAGAEEVRVEGRPVETKADGPCSGLLTTGAQRYADCGNGTIYDTITGLLWLRDVDCSDLGTAGSDVWLQAQRDANDLEHGLCGLTDHSQPGDWRLPTRAEWLLAIDAAVALACVSGGAGGPPSLTDDTGVACYGAGSSSSFAGTLASRYWAADSYEPDPADAHYVDFDSGTVGIADKAGVVLGPLGIWPVRRGGGPGPPAPVVIDGAVAETQRRQTCLAGAGNGAQRYVDCGDGTVLDLHTDLVWLADASCPDLAIGDWPGTMTAIMALANGTCGLSDGSQPGDWRLPTRDEWQDTIQRASDLGCTVAGAGVPPALTDQTGQLCLTDGVTPFTGIEGSYWALDAVEADSVGAVLIDSALVVGDDKSGGHYGWPVRSR